ncbi:MAG: NAD(P)-binding protein [Candidatus Lokiarchaeota archaeon]|nr:NAD(P)-binding protein [Candidatus Lokiarchaeota archaeon]
MEMIKMNEDVLIVGGGFGGLIVGAILAKNGVNVKLFEKKVILGGRANSFEYKKGYVVDYGIHAIRFSKKGVIPRIFKKLLKQKLKIIDYGEGKLFMNNEWHDLPLSMSAIQNTNLLSDEEKQQLTKILAGALTTKIDDKVLDLSIDDWLKDKNLSDNTKNLVRIITDLLCVSYNEIDRLSTGEFLDGIKKAISAGKGSSYPIGGWKFIIDELVKFIEENGEIKTKSKVDKILVNDNKVQGIMVGNQKITSDTVVLALPIKQVYSVIDKSLLSSSFTNKANNVIPTCGISIDFGLNKKISEIDGLICTNKPFTMSCFTSNLDPSVAPNGEQLYTILQPTSHEVIKKKEKTSKMIENLYSMLETMFPGFNDQIKWKRPLVLPLVDGSAVYTSCHRNKRPSIKSKIEGLYFSGDSYNGVGIGGDIAHASAKLCAETILKDKNIF